MFNVSFIWLWLRLNNAKKIEIKINFSVQEIGFQKLITARAYLIYQINQPTNQPTIPFIVSKEFTYKKKLHFSSSFHHTHNVKDMNGKFRDALLHFSYNHTFTNVCNKNTCNFKIKWNNALLFCYIQTYRPKVFFSFSFILTLRPSYILYASLLAHYQTKVMCGYL